MKAKMFEVRAGGEIHPCIALEMSDEVSRDRRRILLGAGYPDGAVPAVMLIFMGDRERCSSSPATWEKEWERKVHDRVLYGFKNMFDGMIIDAD